MPTVVTPTAPIEDFITAWEASGASERANYALFLVGLCDHLGVPRPDPASADDEENAYVFERAVTFQNGDGTTANGWIDLYRRASFVLEAKQGSDRAAAGAPRRPAARRLRRGTATRGTQGWDDAMLAARGQAELYARALPVAEGWPPFLVVVDVGYSIELFADFTQSGKTYLPFPDPRSHRILLRDLAREETRALLRQVWLDPLSLDPSRRTARITREVAAQLGALAKSLEESGHSPEQVAAFLMRCIFTMFAEDVELIGKGSFTELLESLRDRGEVALFPEMAQALWETMNTGGFSPVLRQRLLRFNGGLFESTAALPVSEEQLDLLIRASKAEWKDVEPAIFGTLLERALDPVERHQLGAHYTPRAYVERLVLPTLVEPLREEWEAVRVAAVTLAKEGDLDGAVKQVRAFHRRLCATRVLDPACGSGNFLYVALEHMKRLEGEILDALDQFGQTHLGLEGEGLTVDPHQFLGLEVNPRAAAITDLVLWIGYLQWHFRTRGDAMPREPVIRKFHNIEHRDAVLDYDRVEPLLDDAGQPVTRWDGRTMKPHAVTRQDVPDETARVPVLRFVNPRKAEWPEAEFVVGNPPFVGNKRMRLTLGDGYVEALRGAHRDVPDTSDYVMYWWNHAAGLLRAGKLRRFGFITTNSIGQTFSRQVVERHMSAANGLRLVFAIPDHPWVDSAQGAAVRVAMSVAAVGEHDGIRAVVVAERPSDTTNGESDVQIRLTRQWIGPDLGSGTQHRAVVPLQSNARIGYRGVTLVGDGFLLEPSDPLGTAPVVRTLMGAKALLNASEPRRVIDFFGLEENEARERFPAHYQRLYDTVRPLRLQQKRSLYAKQWWLFAEPRSGFRLACDGIDRYIATVETSKHRWFCHVEANALPEQTLVAMTLADAHYLGVLSSSIHASWSRMLGGRLGVGNDLRYTIAQCFDPFPFPDCDEEQKAQIRELGEALDAHRKRQQSQHPTLTITGMYNVLEKLRAGDALTDRERVTHEQGLVSVLKQIHDDLDTAVFAAYDWPATLSDEEILERLAALNAERARGERAGLVRWLRPEFQNPAGTGQAAMVTDEPEAVATVTAAQDRAPWPRELAEQAKAVRDALAAAAGVVTPEQVARGFRGARADRVEALLQTLASLGQAREVEAGRFAA